MKLTNETECALIEVGVKYSFTTKKEVRNEASQVIWSMASRQLEPRREAGQDGTQTRLVKMS